MTAKSYLAKQKRRRKLKPSMSNLVPEEQLPQTISYDQAVEIAFPQELAQIASDLARGLPVLVECEKDLTPYVFINLRQRLKAQNLKCAYLDGRPSEKAPELPPAAAQFVTNLLIQLRDAVRGAVERKVVVLPHLDLLTTAQQGLTTEAREIIPLLYENPELVWLGFKDPSFPLPPVIEQLFPHHYRLVGLRREKLRQLVTRSEARKFGQGLNPWALYKYVSGLNPVRLRKLLATLEGEDYPAEPRAAYQQIRQATRSSDLEIPQIDLERDIGGYQGVKQKIREDLLEILTHKDQLSDPAEVARLEGLLPRGLIFWGPPGTGKTLFAKAIATALGAAITVVSGPELKSRWVGESEENLRRIFHHARQSAPAIIVFDELDSFASARGTYTGSGVEHSMVNQLLTEMDGFRSEELVFVVGTTNFVEVLDPALLRPGRFEFQLHIPYPEAEDRQAILEIYNRQMRLELAPEALTQAVERTSGMVEGAAAGTRYSGDHLHALCRALARIRLRERLTGPTSVELLERALTEGVDRPQLTEAEQYVVATHEAGHALCALLCPQATPPVKLSILGETSGNIGFVRFEDPQHKYVVTRAQLLDDLCVMFGGREAESLLLGDVSIGAQNDLRRATTIARMLVEELGMGGDFAGVRCFTDQQPGTGRQAGLSELALDRLDKAIQQLLDQARTRAAELLAQHQPQLERLRGLLLERKTISAADLPDLLA